MSDGAFNDSGSYVGCVIYGVATYIEPLKMVGTLCNWLWIGHLCAMNNPQGPFSSQRARSGIQMARLIPTPEALWGCL